MSALVDAVDHALRATKALRAPGRPRDGFYEIEGMSGWRYRFFINALIGSLDNPGYLEVGLWAGSTFCAAIAGNNVRAVGIDNWSGVYFKEQGRDIPAPREEFYKNFNAFKTPGTEPDGILETDFRNVNYKNLPHKFDVFFFDGPHTAEDQYDGLRLALPALKHEFVYIVDDWNWPQVREGTMAAIAELKVNYSCQIRTTLDDTHPEVYGAQSEWHNGCFISVLEKPA